MNTSRFEFSEIIKLLGRSEYDHQIQVFFGQALSDIERDEHYGSLEFKPDGVDVVFKKAPWVLPPTQISDPKMLHLCAFHLHREGHEGYAGYRGQLPSDVALGDSEADVLRKMGQPVVRGGGVMSTVLRQPIPRWFRYSLGDAVLHFQLDASGCVEMVTLAVPDFSSSSPLKKSFR